MFKFKIKVWCFLIVKEHICFGVHWFLSTGSAKTGKKKRWKIVPPFLFSFLLIFQRLFLEQGGPVLPCAIVVVNSQSIWFLTENSPPAFEFNLL